MTLFIISREFNRRSFKPLLFMEWPFVSDYFSTLLLSTDSQILKSTTIAIIVTILLFLLQKLAIVSISQIDISTSSF